MGTDHVPNLLIVETLIFLHKHTRVYMKQKKRASRNFSLTLSSRKSRYCRWCSRKSCSASIALVLAFFLPCAPNSRQTLILCACVAEKRVMRMRSRECPVLIRGRYKLLLREGCVELLCGGQRVNGLRDYIVHNSSR